MDSAVRSKYGLMNHCGSRIPPSHLALAAAEVAVEGLECLHQRLDERRKQPNA